MNYIVSTAVTAVLTGCFPAFVKAGNKKNAPVFTALFVSCAGVVFSLIAALMNGSLPILGEITNDTLLYLLLSGTVHGLFLLCLSTAVTHGEIGLAVPIVNLKGILLTFVSYLMLHERISTGKLCFMIVLLLGTVFLESRTERKSSARWVLFSFLALFLLSGSYYIDTMLLPAEKAATECYMLIRFLIASAILAGISFIGNGFKKVKKLTAANWISMSAAGLSCGFIWLLNRITEAGDPLVTYLITCLYFPVAMIAAKIFHREKFPVGAVAGIVLVVAGMAGMRLFS